MKCYIEYTVQLHHCIVDPENFKKELESWLIRRLNPDLDSDVEVTLETSTIGNHNDNSDS